MNQYTSTYSPETRAHAVRMRATGATHKEIADSLGVSRSTVSAWCDPAHAAKQARRRERYGRPCVDCGVRTDGSGGFKKQRTRCLACSRKAQTKYDAAEIVRLYASGLSTYAVAARIGTSHAIVYRHVRRAGIARTKAETRRLDPARAYELVYAEDWTMAEVAAEFGVTDFAVFQALGHHYPNRHRIDPVAKRERRRAAA